MFHMNVELLKPTDQNTTIFGPQTIQQANSE